MIKEIYINTTKRNEFIDITGLIDHYIKDIDEGVITLFVPHTTAGLTINENSDINVQLDILRKISELIPKNDNYKHLEGNSDAHLKASLFGNTLNLVVKEGKLMLGVWQAIYFCEFDGPRKRKFLIKY